MNGHVVYHNKFRVVEYKKDNSDVRFDLKLKEYFRKRNKLINPF